MENDIIQQMIADASVDLYGSDEERFHLGASVLGQCQKMAWFGYHKVSKGEDFDGRMLRLFNRGHLEEKRNEALMERMGLEIIKPTPDGSPDPQHRVKALGGHFRGSMDHVVRGFKDCPDIFFLVEEKTHNKKNFDKLKKGGLAKEKPVHLTQMHVYMYLSGLTQGIYWAVCKDNDDIYTEIIQASPLIAQLHLEKAKHIIESTEGVQGISDNPSWFECKWCAFKDNCHGRAVPEKNCRTCVHASPDMTGEDGQWKCAFNQPEVLEEKGTHSCDSWLPNPATMPKRDMVHLGEGEDIEDQLIMERCSDGTTLHSYASPIEPSDII